MALAKAALSTFGQMDTREMVIHIMAAKGLDTGDKVLAKARAFRMIHALRQQCWRAKLTDAGKRSNVRVWAMPTGGLL